MKVIILEVDDWVAIYVNGESVYQGHNIRPLEFLKLSETYNFKSSQIHKEYLEDGPDRDKVESFGSFPQKISDLSGTYGPKINSVEDIINIYAGGDLEAFIQEVHKFGIVWDFSDNKIGKYGLSEVLKLAGKLEKSFVLLATPKLMSEISEVLATDNAGSEGVSYGLFDNSKIENGDLDMIGFFRGGVEVFAFPVGHLTESVMIPTSGTNLIYNSKNSMLICQEN